MFTFEVRYTPDDLPLGIFPTYAAAVRYARKRAERKGMGPYLIYEMHDQTGERFVGEAG